MGAKKGTRPPSAGKPKKKGTLNKITRAAKEAFEIAFEGLGGVDGLIAWGERNRGEFYKLYARLIPATLNGGALVNITMPGANEPITTAEQAAEIYRTVLGDPSIDFSQVTFAPSMERLPAPTLKAPEPITPVQLPVVAPDDEQPPQRSPVANPQPARPSLGPGLVWVNLDDY